MRNSISQTEVYDFKVIHCDENPIIISKLKNLDSFFLEPILDVGAGIGDIAYYAFYEKKALLIDTNPISELDFPLSPNHKRITVNFFDFENSHKINTVLICHTLQFIDDDVKKLNEKIQQIQPMNIILVINANNDFMGEIIQWTQANFKYSNPEKKLANFPENYQLNKTLNFSAKIKCPNFQLLAQQVSYLMLINLEDKEQLLVDFLIEHLQIPEFTFNQEIQIYQKHG